MFTRGAPLPPNAIFTGFATRWVEVWQAPDNFKAVYVVPRTNERLAEIGKWPAMPSAGFCE